MIDESLPAEAEAQSPDPVKSWAAPRCLDESVVASITGGNDVVGSIVGRYDVVGSLTADWVKTLGLSQRTAEIIQSWSGGVTASDWLKPWETDEGPVGALASITLRNDVASIMGRHDVVGSLTADWFETWEADGWLGESLGSITAGGGAVGLSQRTAEIIQSWSGGATAADWFQPLGLSRRAEEFVESLPPRLEDAIESTVVTTSQPVVHGHEVDACEATPFRTLCGIWLQYAIGHWQAQSSRRLFRPATALVGYLVFWAWWVSLPLEVHTDPVTSQFMITLIGTVCGVWGVSGRGR